MRHRRQRATSVPGVTNGSKCSWLGKEVAQGKFERGVSQHPTINDPVHIVTEEDLRTIYGPGNPVDFVSVGHLASTSPSLR